MPEKQVWVCPRCGNEFAARCSLGAHSRWCRMSAEERSTNHPMYGKHHKPETRQKLSDAARKRFADPANHPNHGKRGVLSLMYGRPKSIEHRKRISDAHKGKKYSPETLLKMSKARRGKYCGVDSWCYGRHLSAETKEKIAEAHRGANSVNWKGGPFPYGPDWSIQRKRVRIRDNFTCQRCGATEAELGHELAVHHVRPFRESNDNSVENLITLCCTKDNGCHRYCENHPERCPEPRKHWLLTVEGVGT